VNPASILASIFWWSTC